MAKKKSKIEYRVRRPLSHRDYGRKADLPWEMLPSGAVVDEAAFAHLNHHEVNLLVDMGVIELIVSEEVIEENNDG